MINTGVYTDLSNEDYHADSAISRSKLMDFEVSPFHYWAMHINPDRPPRKSSQAMDIGQAFHDMILSPDIFSKQYQLEPKKVLLKDAGREAYEHYKRTLEALEKSGQTVLSASEWNLLIDMESALKKNENAWELIHGAIYEQSHFWKDTETSLMLKCKPDILHKNMVVDFKTTKDASPRGFQRAIVEYGYHLQAAIIQEGIKETEGRLIENFIYVCEEKTYPYHIGIYILDDFALEAGREKFKSLKYDLAQCLKNNEWPDYGIQNISLPKWAL